ncbi:MAG: hypothetical protein CM1200mP14_24480 [Gammaproteobacteria bacterium]|nr:MAG: hypothetical protein CM1200mP14_24480 [Gammaproteobacteria bacterium]
MFGRGYLGTCVPANFNSPGQIVVSGDSQELMGGSS